MLCPVHYTAGSPTHSPNHSPTHTHSLSLSHTHTHTYPLALSHIFTHAPTHPLLLCPIHGTFSGPSHPRPSYPHFLSPSLSHPSHVSPSHAHTLSRLGAGQRTPRHADRAGLERGGQQQDGVLLAQVRPTKRSAWRSHVNTALSLHVDKLWQPAMLIKEDWAQIGRAHV